MTRRRPRGCSTRYSDNHLPLAAIVAAGGSGRRAGSDLPKQFRDLCGRPLIRWSLDALLDYGFAPVVVAVPPGSEERAAEITAPDSRVKVVAGGDTRQDSVFNALQLVDGARVLVHDAARPFLDRALIDRVVHALEGWDGAVAAVPVGDTVKRVRDGRVVETVDRSELWSAQTPQAFVTDVLRGAHQRARQEGFSATDDAQLVERYGGRVTVVPAPGINLKITAPDDFRLAEELMRRRE